MNQRAMRVIIFSLLVGVVAALATDKAFPIMIAPVLKVDDAHWMAQRPAGQKPADPYIISPSPSLVLDAAGYRFDPAKELRDKPLNSIQVIQNKTHQFEVTWETNKTRYELSGATLKPKPGSQPFTGFTAGDKIVIAIGVQEPPKFFPVWFGIIEVK
jgi:hypothetical protein